VYDVLLCTFAPPAKLPEDLPVSEYFQIRTLGRYGAAILRTSRQVHREASDYMVKTNRFVSVRNTTTLPFYGVIQTDDIFPVSTDAQNVSQFKGYLLELTMSSPEAFPDEEDNPIPMHPMSAMLLARDLPEFCHSMSRGTACLLSSLALYGSTSTSRLCLTSLWYLTKTHLSGLSQTSCSRLCSSRSKPIYAV
jgi:hypothetical protein